MTDDQQDMIARLRAVLPTRWFPDSAPVLDGLLSGLASGWSWAYQQLLYVKAQTRIATATDVWLDIIANDYFGGRLARRVGQSDGALRNRIQRELFRERGTRGTIIDMLNDLTGRAPLVFEPARTTDTGGYATLTGAGGGVGYGKAGGWGSLTLPFQCFITAYRPVGSGIATVCGWGCSAGGYGRGAIEYASLEMVQGQVTDADIYAAVANVLPVAVIGWTRITS
jgi:hypothetical protein